MERNEKGQFIKGCNLRESHPLWKGGKFKRKDGYVMTTCIGHSRASCGKRYVLEHIIIAEKKLGRELNKGEVVHHINGIRDDNSPDNLVVMKIGDHLRRHFYGSGLYKNIDYNLFKKHYEDGMTYKEMGNVFNCHKSTIYILRNKFKLPKRCSW